MNVSENIKSARISAGLTQTEVAKRMGISVQSYSQYERGIRKPKMETLSRIAKVLCVPVAVLYDQTGEVLRWQQTIEDIENEPVDDPYEHFARIKHAEARLSEAERNAELQYKQGNTSSLLSAFNSLNAVGQKVAIERVQELAKIEDYRRSDKPDGTTPAAGTDKE